jgi:hypothetical protein
MARAWLAHQWRMLVAAVTVGGVIFWGCPAGAAAHRSAEEATIGRGGELSE